MYNVLPGMYAILLAALLLLGSCGGSTTANSESHYVTDSYHQRAEGYDWVSVTLSNVNESSAQLRVRSRSDKKKATCTYAGTLKREDDGTYTTPIEGGVMVVHVEGETLHIGTKDPENAIRLMWYCSGGGTMEGSYAKITEPLDTSQFAAQ